jgi:C-terminal processing protease CtpA/Prc
MNINIDRPILSIKRPKKENQTMTDQAPDTESTESAQPKKNTEIECRAEITLKFNELPTVENPAAKSVQFHLKAGDYIVTVNVKGKSWRKVATAAEGFDQFVIAIGGKVGKKTPAGFELEGAGCQIFEKKPKPPKEPKAAPPAE